MEANLVQFYNYVNPEVIDILLEFIKNNNRKMFDDKFIVCQPVVNHYGQKLGSLCFTVVEKSEEDTEKTIYIKTEKVDELTTEYYIVVRPFSRLTLVISVERWL